MAELTAELAVSLRQVHRVDVTPEHHVYVRTLPASTLASLDGKDQLAIASLLLCHEDGTARTDDISEWPLYVAQRIVEVGLQINGLGEDSESLKKK